MHCRTSAIKRFPKNWQIPYLKKQPKLTSQIKVLKRKMDLCDSITLNGTKISELHHTDDTVLLKWHPALENRCLEGKSDRERGKGIPRITWSVDIKEWMDMSETDACHLANQSTDFRHLMWEVTPLGMLWGWHTFVYTIFRQYWRRHGFNCFLNCFHLLSQLSKAFLYVMRQSWHYVKVGNGTFRTLLGVWANLHHAILQRHVGYQVVAFGLSSLFIKTLFTHYYEFSTLWCGLLQCQQSNCIHVTHVKPTSTTRKSRNMQHGV